MTVRSVFAPFTDQVYPFTFAGTLHLATIAGGTPSDPKVTEGWLRSKLTDKKDDLIRDMVVATMLERGISEDEALAEVDMHKHLNGFRRDQTTGELYIEGRQLKAALKEAAMVAVNAGNLRTKGWGNPEVGTMTKWLKSWFPEHVFVQEQRLYLGVDQPTGIVQRFVHTSRGAAIQYEEYCENVSVDFTVVTDYDFSEKEWAAIWLTGQNQGLGASRSQGFGTYVVTRWERG